MTNTVPTVLMLRRMARKSTCQQNCYKECFVVMQEKVNDQESKFTIFCQCVHVILLGGLCYQNKIETMTAPQFLPHRYYCFSKGGEKSS